MTQQLTQLTDHVWIWPHHPDADRVQAAVGVITAGHETLLVDAGNGPELARRIKAALRQQGLPPISRIIYTHHHWDHVFGAYIFGVPVLAHETCLPLMTAMSQGHWGPERLVAYERNPRLRLAFQPEDWRDFQVVLPQELFSGRHQLALDGVTLELEHVGGVHAADSILVKVVEEGVMFLGDCYYPPNHTDEPISTDMLAQLLDDSCHLYVDGHRDPYSKAKLERVIRLYRRLARRT